LNDSLNVDCLASGGSTIIITTTICKNCIEMREGPSWSWSYASWIYSYLCNQYLSPL